MAFLFQTAAAAFVFTLLHPPTHTHTHTGLSSHSLQTKGPADVKPFKKPRSEPLFAVSDDAPLQFAHNTETLLDLRVPPLSDVKAAICFILISSSVCLAPPLR